jgi:hypothetical protein
MSITCLEESSGLMRNRSAAILHVLRSEQSRLTKLLCIFALGLNALLPSGFMLMRADGIDQVQVVICTGHGPQTIVLDDAGQPKSADHKQNTKNRCDFASVGSVALADGLPLRLFAQVRYAAITYRVSREVASETPKPGAVSARGPPIDLI